MPGQELRAAEEKMRTHGQHEEAIRNFRNAYQRLTGGESGIIRTADLDATGDVPRFDDLPEVDPSEALEQVAVIKLNGGLATTMGLRSPKSLVQARDGRSFLDVIIGRTLVLRELYGVRLPLVLMNSEATRRHTREAHPELEDFMQSMIPKLDAETLGPVSWPAEPALEWCPPGHGDVYGALRRSGMLESLLEHGLRYAMISNADNLGASVDARIAGHIARREIPFLMEVVEGTEADRKGGHIARRRSDHQLVLRETAQTAPEDEESFRDYRRWRWYNTNSLWVDLRVLHEALDRRDGVLELSLIVNRKTVDPRDSSTPAVLQLESAMGSAIGVFEGAEIVHVPRSRFVPVKTTDDLLVMRSDVYALTDEYEVAPCVEQLPYVELDKRYFKLLDEFERRFPGGPPGLRKAERLVVTGDVTFGPGVTVEGAVEIDSDEPLEIAAGTVLTSSE